MNIGIIIARIGGVDGVALETEKWIEVLERLGHRVSILTGELEREIEGVTVVEELGLYSAFSLEEQESAFHEGPLSKAGLERLLKEHAAFLEAEIQRWVKENELHLVVAQNLSALPCHLSAGMAVAQAAESLDIGAILHHHDFWWERGERYKSPHESVERIKRALFPPKGDRFQHVVINSYNQKRLKETHGLEATRVPNVMDFGVGFGERDDYNVDFKEEMGLDGDLSILSQVTRVVARKGIETALELVERLGDPRVRLLITGQAVDDPGGRYLERLQRLISKKSLEDRVLFIGHRVDHRRGTSKEGQKVYSLSDVYAHSHACTYFSTYEGFGNAFVEACAAKTPIFVNDYQPVYWPDIGSLGFRTVMTREGVLTEEHVNRVAEILHDERLARRIADHNYELAKEHFSYETLEQILSRILGD